MKPVKLIAASEKEIAKIGEELKRIEQMFPLNDPKRQAFNDARTKLIHAAQANRIDPTQEQIKWVYVVESDHQL